jgi:opacity protein-like surface antigen
MTTRFAALATLAALAVPATASAQNQTLTFSFGYFAVTGEDGRVDDDVLVADLSIPPELLFDIGDFSGGYIGGDWVVGVGEFLEVGAGLGYYRETVPSIYRDRVRPDQTEIFQELKLRITPLTATVRFLPFGRGRFEPYVGAGIGFFNWRYSETGEFVDSSDDSIFRASYVADGTDTGPVILGGFRYVADPWVGGFELRWQDATGTLPTTGENAFLGSKIDLGGFTTQFSFGLRF